VQALNLSDAQRFAIDSIVDQYLQESHRIGQAGQDALFEAGGKRMNEMIVLLNQGRATPEDQVALERQIAPLVRELGHKLQLDLDRTLHTYVDQIVTDLSFASEQTDRLWNLIGRKYYFRTIGGPRDFVTRLDLHDLVRQASANGSELAAIAEARPESALWPAHEALTAIMDSYDESLRAFLRKEMQDRLQRPPEDTVFLFTSAGDPGWNEYAEQAAVRWKREYQLIGLPQRSIRDLLAESFGASQAQQWDDRFFRKICPRLMGEFFPDGLKEWVGGHIEPDALLLNKIGDIVHGYALKRLPLQRAAVLAGIAAHMLGPMGVNDTPACKAYARALLALHRLGRDTIGEVMAVLPREERDRMSQQLRRERSVTGPPPPPFLASKTGYATEFEKLLNFR